MASFCQQRRQRYPEAIVTSCRRTQCDLKLQNWQPADLAILDLDRFHASYQGLFAVDRRADFVLAFCEDGLHVLTIEMKTGRPKHAPAGQLEATLTALDRLLGSQNVDSLRLLILHRGIRSTDLNFLRRCKVPFRGRKYGIYVKPCGSAIGEVLRLP